MKTRILVIALFFLWLTVRPATAALFDDLADLKKICDAKLLSESQCETRQAAILAKFDNPSDSGFCNYAGESTVPVEFATVSQMNYSESASASSIVKEILDLVGLAPNFIVRPSSVPNAAASTRNGERYVEYNPAFIALLKNGTNTNWSVYSVMAHELGHHLQGHTLQAGGSRPSIELEADDYSGFVLAKLGASLSQSQVAMNTFGSNSSSGTHPPTQARLKAIKTGWDRGNVGATNTASPSSPVKPATTIPSSTVVPPQSTANYSDSCVVNGEPVLITTAGAVLSRVRGFMQVAQKVPPMHPSCMFDMVGSTGRYCVASNGSVYFGTPMPVGQCQPCVGNLCS